jgi:hypothetical protein
LVRGNPNGTELEVSYSTTLFGRVVLANEDDPAFPEAQESIIECTKDQQDVRSVKIATLRRREAAITGETGYRSAATTTGPVRLRSSFQSKQNFWDAAIATTRRLRSPNNPVLPSRLPAPVSLEDATLTPQSDPCAAGTYQKGKAYCHYA